MLRKRTARMGIHLSALRKTEGGFAVFAKEKAKL
jgi:hypothetical protein